MGAGGDRRGGVDMGGGGGVNASSAPARTMVALDSLRINKRRVCVRESSMPEPYHTHDTHRALL